MNFYAAYGLVLFFALGFGAGVVWATRRLAPTPDDAADAEPSGHGAFWADLNRRMEDPEFRDAYAKESLRIQAIDAQANGEDGPS